MPSAILELYDKRAPALGYADSGRRRNSYCRRQTAATGPAYIHFFFEKCVSGLSEPSGAMGLRTDVDVDHVAVSPLKLSIGTQTGTFSLRIVWGQ